MLPGGLWGPNQPPVRAKSCSAVEEVVVAAAG